jgi:hypothetical protein
LDTRSKIVAGDAVPAGCTVVTGYFEMLAAEDSRELGGLQRPVVAIVLPLEEELLGQRARAEMAAALRVIDYVVIAETARVDALCERLRPARIVAIEAAQALRTRQLMEHVRNRQTR